MGFGSNFTKNKTLMYFQRPSKRGSVIHFYTLYLYNTNMVGLKFPLYILINSKWMVFINPEVTYLNYGFSEKKNSSGHQLHFQCIISEGEHDISGLGPLAFRLAAEWHSLHRTVQKLSHPTSVTTPVKDSWSAGIPAPKPKQLWQACHSFK